MPETVTSTSNYVGAVIGQSSTTVIENCGNKATVSGNNYVGGIVGGTSGGSITSCKNKVPVTGYSYVGGIVGKTASSTAITSCVNNAEITATGYTISGYYGNCAYLGGIAGVSDGGQINGCINNANVTGGYRSVGGISGYSTSSHTDCVNNAEILGTDYTGGIAGVHNKGSLPVTGCKNVAAITGTSYVGGIVGRNSAGEITDCTNASVSAVTGSSIYVGGIAGQSGGKISYSRNFAAVSSTGTSSYAVGGISGCSSADIDSCQNRATVSSSSSRNATADPNGNKGIVGVGGIAGGASNGSITKTINSGNVSAPNMTCVGGFIGNAHNITFTSADNNFLDTITNPGLQVAGNKYVATYIGYATSSTISDLENKFRGVTDNASGRGGIVGGTSSGSITNCKNKVPITGISKVGGIVGETSGTAITSCVNDAEITATGYIDGGYYGNCAYLGGIAGVSDGGQINGCINNANVTGGYRSVGGISGYSTSSHTDCVNNAEILGTDYTGGIAGVHNKGSLPVTGCKNVAAITGTSYVGGIVGRNSAGEITDCTNASVSAVTGSSIYVGGIAGQSGGKISYSRNFAAVSSTGTSSYAVGGISGCSSADIDSCQNRATVSSSSSRNATADPNGNKGIVGVGGIAGGASNGSITKTINSGNVSAPNMTCVGGFIGNAHNITFTSADNNFLDTITNPGLQVAGNKYVATYIGYATSSTISDLENKFRGVTDNASCIGGIVGGTSGGSITICKNKVPVTGISKVGGIVGETSSTAITSCVNEAKVSGINNVGGIVGEAIKTAVTSCDNEAEVSASGERVGGIAGCGSSYGSFTECTNNAKVAAAGIKYVGGIAGYSTTSYTDCVNNAEIQGGPITGGIVGFVNNGDNTTTSGCTNTALVTGTSSVGGIIGELSNPGIVTTCTNQGAVTGSSYYIGGVVGYAHGGSIENCYSQATATISSTFANESDNQYGVGGIIGKTTIAIRNCDNYSTVSAPNMHNAGGIAGICTSTISGCTNYSESISAAKNSGGIVGCQNGGTVSLCENKGELSFTTPSAGGIAGYLIGDAVLDRCVNKASIKTSSYNAGGIVGQAVYFKIDNCFNYNSVTGISSTDSYNIGGLIGYLAGGGSKCTIRNSGNSGSISTNCSNSSNGIGGFVGYSNPTYQTTIANCYSTGGVTAANMDNVGGFVGKSVNTVFNTCYAGATSLTGHQTRETDQTFGAFAGNISNNTQLINSFYRLDCGNAVMQGVGNTTGGTRTNFKPFMHNNLSSDACSMENSDLLSSLEQGVSELNNSVYAEWMSDVAPWNNSGMPVFTRIGDFAAVNFGDSVPRYRDSVYMAPTGTFHIEYDTIPDLDEFGNMQYDDDNHLIYIEIVEHQIPDSIEVTVQVFDHKELVHYTDTLASWTAAGVAPTLTKPNIYIDSRVSVSYVSSDPSVATVDDEGNVTPVSVGVTTITAVPTNINGENIYSTPSSYIVTLTYDDTDIEVVQGDRVEGVEPYYSLSLEGTNITDEHFYEYEPVIFDWNSNERLASDAWNSSVETSSSILTTTTKANTSIDLTGLDVFDITKDSIFMMRYRVLEGSIDKINVNVTTDHLGLVSDDGDWHICKINLTENDSESGMVDGATIKFSDQCVTIEIDWAGFFSQEVDNPYNFNHDQTIYGAEFSVSKTTARKASEDILPIELLSFTAKCSDKGALVTWSTASEKNNDYFILERSDDAQHFEEVTRMAGAGNSLVTLYYSYEDTEIYSGDTYYRLWQVDYNGQRSVSEIIVVTCNDNMMGEEPEANVYPNPFLDELTVELSNFGEATVNVEVYDMLGRMYAMEKVESPMGYHMMTLNLGDLAPATYCVRIISGDTMIVKKVVKQK